MKHPALARVFTIVLSILSVLLIVTGIRGFDSSQAEHEERLAYEKKYTDRIDQFIHLQSEINSSADYEETMRALKTFVSAHEKAASQHKTDTALYSAAKGGLAMGESMIVSLQAEMEDLRRQLKDTNSRKAFLEGLLTELIASQKSQMPWLDSLANTAAGYAVDSYNESTGIALASAKLRALMENEPSPADFIAAVYSPPEAPSVPELPSLSALNGLPYDAMQAAYQAAMSQYQSELSAYMQSADAYAMQLQDYYDAMAHSRWDSVQTIEENAVAAAGDEAVRLQYTAAHKAWEEECRDVKSSLDFSSIRSRIQRLNAALTSVTAQLRQLPSAWLSEYEEFLTGLDELYSLSSSIVSRLDALSSSDASAMTNEEFLRLTDDLEELLDMMTDAFTVIASDLNDPAHLITEIMEKLNISRTLAKYLDDMLDKAERQMQTSLEELWYQLGQMERDQLKLEAEKLGLDREAKLLSSRTRTADELKDLRKQFTSVRQFLISAPEVKSGMHSDEDLPQTARAYLDSYSHQTQNLYLGRRISDLLSAIGGCCGIAAIPAAFEFVKSAALLILPISACLLCAAGACLLNMILGLGPAYAALFTAVFALIDLLVVLPRRKSSRHRPKHLIS